MAQPPVEDATRGSPAPPGAPRPGSGASDAEVLKHSAEDDLVTTEHEVDLDGERVRYVATCGRVVLREEVYDGDTFTGVQDKAEVFLTSYVRQQRPGAQDETDRPVTFAFNGGPGSSSVWLHLGVLGPRRVQMGDVGDLRGPPPGLADNPESLLATSDLVFIDPVSTGYSRAVAGGEPSSFHGFTGDIESVGEIIRMWTSRHGRWMSPKLLAGESYGTLRAAALADHLQTRFGMYLNGVILLSSVLDMGSIRFFDQGNDRACISFLPTYAAIAHFHGRHPEGVSLQEVVDRARAYCERDYPWALSRGSRLTGAERAEHVATVAELTGLAADWVDRADLRIEHQRFYAELLRHRSLVVGRLDARFTGPARDGNAEMAEADPSYDAIAGPYAAALNHYVRHELGYASDLHYEQLSSRVQPWSYADFEGRPVEVATRLSRAMRANPHLRVHVAYGWYDGATPFFGAEEVLHSLDIPATARERIEHHYYPAGHMMYVHEPSRRRQCADLAAFVRAACPRP
jgi:carboxypeptidase C (cathepsin A)